MSMNAQYLTQENLTGDAIENGTENQLQKITLIREYIDALFSDSNLIPF